MAKQTTAGRGENTYQLFRGLRNHWLLRILWDGLLPVLKQLQVVCDDHWLVSTVDMKVELAKKGRGGGMVKV